MENLSKSNDKCYHPGAEQEQTFNDAGMIPDDHVTRHHHNIPIIFPHERLVCSRCGWPLKHGTLVYEYPPLSANFYHKKCLRLRINDDDFLVGVELNPGPPMTRDEVVPMGPTVCAMCHGKYEFNGYDICNRCYDITDARRVTSPSAIVRDKSDMVLSRCCNCAARMVDHPEYEYCTVCRTKRPCASCGNLMEENKFNLCLICRAVPKRDNCLLLNIDLDEPGDEVSDVPPISKSFVKDMVNALESKSDVKTPMVKVHTKPDKTVDKERIPTSAKTERLTKPARNKGPEKKPRAAQEKPKQIDPVVVAPVDSAPKSKKKRQPKPPADKQSADGDKVNTALPPSQSKPLPCPHRGRRGGCNNVNCVLDHDAPVLPKSNDKKVRAAVREMDQKAHGHNDAQKEIDRQLKEEERVRDAAEKKRKQKKKKYDHSFFKRDIPAPDNFMHMVEGPMGVARPDLAFFIAFLFMFWECLLIYTFEYVGTALLKRFFASYFPAVPTLSQMFFNSTLPSYLGLFSDLTTIINILLFLKNVGSFFVHLVFREYDLTVFLNLSFCGRLMAPYAYELIGICENNSFILYERKGEVNGDNIESRCQNRRDPDVRIPTKYDEWKVRRGNLFWPVNKRPPIFFRPAQWLTPKNFGHGPRLKYSKTLISYDAKISFTANDKILEDHPILNTGAYMTDSTTNRTSRTLLMTLLSARNVSRQITFEQAKVFIQRDAGSINTINVDARATMEMQNIVANTTTLALAWLMHDRQKCQVFTDSVNTDFRLRPQH